MQAALLLVQIMIMNHTFPGDRLKIYVRSTDIRKDEKLSYNLQSEFCKVESRDRSRRYEREHGMIIRAQ